LASGNQPVFILVRPQLGENIGAAARAMANFGLRNLRIVAPRDGWPNRMADDTSSGAFDEMDEIKIFPTLAEAAADLHYLYAVTARPRDIAKSTVTPDFAIQNLKPGTAFVFGPERTGLENDEVAQCQTILTIPSNPAFPVLNLAQSVSLLSWEIFKAQDKTPGKIDNHDAAPLEKFEDMFTRLQSELEETGFFKTDDIKPRMIRNIRAMFLRGLWSDQEIRTFQGIISALISKK
jgi:tRNA/rRNA methyltransferase